MRSLWSIPGLPAELRRVYVVLSEARRLICVGKKRLVVYAGSVVDMETEIASLIHLGLLSKKKIGKRRVLLLGTWEILEKRFTSDSAGVSTVFTADMTGTLERYSEAQQRVIEQAFTAFGATRKSGHVSPGILLRQLQTYERYTTEAVVNGLRIYLEGGHAETGKREQYALGIIRGCAKSVESNEPVAPTRSAVETDQEVTRRLQKRKVDRERYDARVLEVARELYGSGVQLARLESSRLAQIVRIVKAEQGE